MPCALEFVPFVEECGPLLADMVRAGLGHILALHRRSSTSFQIH
jgi:hypothetical protein